MAFRSSTKRGLYLAAPPVRRLFSAPSSPFFLSRGVCSSCSSSVMHFEHQFIGVRRSIWTVKEDTFLTAVTVFAFATKNKQNSLLLANNKKRQQYGFDRPLHRHGVFEGHMRLL